MVVLSEDRLRNIPFQRLKFQTFLFHNYFHRRAILGSLWNSRLFGCFRRIFLQVSCNSFR
jgi:hypothetical protein